MDELGEEGSSTEDMDPEEKEEFKEDVEESKENVSSLKKALNSLKDIDVKAGLKAFVKFVGEQIAIAAVFYGVNLALNKLIKGGDKSSSGGSGGDTEANKQKLKKCKALTTLNKDIATIANAFTHWMTEHQKDRVTIAEGIEVPLTDVFFKYKDKLEDVS